ncbi:hypothetical protein G5C60_32375 [Streptomyces sp. HC44]|uniref:Uncharacterized protein n=1 Tax=Streptomyces scabichelini TaxID=2711217 RepID=A0A6G4VEE8_9ACTN|nr:hypothetical protein [Streptomyces scabichelini]NGO12177.1 hypothetical protein [Streptomyces scabichelini]
MAGGRTGDQGAAGILNIALRLAVKYHAWGPDGSGAAHGSLTEAARVALGTAITGLGL